MQPFTVDPNGLDAFATKCEGHSQNVAGQTSSTPELPTQQQMTGIVVAALYELVTGHGAAMSRELSANGQGASLAGQKFSERESDSAFKLADVLTPLSSMGGNALSAVGSFAGQGLSSVTQGINGAVQGINGAVQNMNRQQPVSPVSNPLPSYGSGAGGSVGGSAATTPESAKSPYNPVAHNTENDTREGGKPVGAQGDTARAGGSAMPGMVRPTENTSTTGRHRAKRFRVATEGS